MPYKKGQKWIAQVRKDGERQNKVFHTKKEAMDWEVKMRRKPVSDWPRKTDTVCIDDWAQLYLDFAKSKFSDKTYKEKKSIFKRFLKEFDPVTPVTQVKMADVMTYILAQKEKRSGYAANKDRKNLKAEIFQKRPQQLIELGIVVDDENSAFHGAMVAAGMPGRNRRSS